MYTRWNISFIVCIMLLFTTCKEKYVPQLKEVETGYLVVEGFINSGAGPTTINLSRTTTISFKDTIASETKATIRVEGKLNTSGFALTETSAGIYTNAQLVLNQNDQYRVHIKTSNGKEYVSDYSSVRHTPDIDSIAWRREFGDVKIYANAHNNKDTNNHYVFKVEETWEFYSNIPSYVKVYNDARGAVNHIGFADSLNPLILDSSIFKCWKTNYPSSILTLSTEKLTQNIVSMFPVITIPHGDWRLSVLYSANVKMYAASRENSIFLDLMRKNTETLGSIFDAQPSDNNGNMHSLSDPQERVIGFVEVSEEKTQRIFISNAQVPGWDYTDICELTFKSLNSLHELQITVMPVNGVIQATPFTLTNYDPGRKDFDSVIYAPAHCVDCRTRGVNKKPAFWP